MPVPRRRSSMPFSRRSSKSRLRTKLARYECKAFGKTFSNQTFSDDFRQHRQDINRMLPRLLCSGVAMRRAAWILECSYNNVRSRLPWLAEKARTAHEAALASGDLDTSYIQFDEMQSFEHSAAKPLTIALAVRAKTGQISRPRLAEFPRTGTWPPTAQAQQFGCWWDGSCVLMLHRLAIQPEACRYWLDAGGATSSAPPRDPAPDRFVRHAAVRPIAAPLRSRNARECSSMACSGR